MREQPRGGEADSMRAAAARHQRYPVMHAVMVPHTAESLRASWSRLSPKADLLNLGTQKDRKRSRTGTLDTVWPMTYIRLTGQEGAMAHGRDKPGREKRKPKKEKNAAPKASRESEVLQHVSQHAPEPER